METEKVVSIPVTGPETHAEDKEAEPEKKMLKKTGKG